MRKKVKIRLKTWLKLKMKKLAMILGNNNSLKIVRMGIKQVIDCKNDYNSGDLNANSSDIKGQTLQNWENWL